MRNVYKPLCTVNVNSHGVAIIKSNINYSKYRKRNCILLNQSILRNFLEIDSNNLIDNLHSCTY